MAIGTTAALISGAALLGSAALSNNATKAAANAAERASDQNAAVNREIYQQTRADLQPYSQAGQPALNALLERAGLATPANANAPATNPVPAVSQGPSGPDWSAYLRNNPDVAQEYERARSTADPNSPAFQQAGLQSPEAYAQTHYQRHGQAEGRDLPQYAQAPAAAPAPELAAAPKAGNAGPSPAESMMGAPRPDPVAAPTFTRPDDLAVPTFERAPDEAAPGMASYFSSFEESPDYQFRRSQGLDAANSGFAARGMLKSGAAAKGITDFASNLASAEYGNWFARQMQKYQAAADAYRYDQNRYDQNFNLDRTYGTNLWANQQGRQDQNFENDRGFGTDAYRYTQGRNDNVFSEDRAFGANRYDQQTANLFGIAGIGQNAAAGTASAGNVFAQNSSANNNQRATTTANAALAGAANTSNLIGQGLQAYGMYKGGAF